MRIILHRNFEKKYRKLDPKLKERFRRRRDLFLQQPLHPLLKNHPLTGDRKGQWSINITGDWRAVYVWRDKDAVVFLDLDTHSNLYG